jgi:hypothetical protein
MRIANRANLSLDRHAVLERELPEHHTLLEVVNWGLAEQPPALVAEAVTLDEFTHDIVIPWRDGLVLVYGAT